MRDPLFSTSSSGAALVPDWLRKSFSTRGFAIPTRAGPTAGTWSVSSSGATHAALSFARSSPGDAARFIEELAPSVANQKIALAALRQFFDLLVTRHAVLLNPFHSVQGPPRGSLDGKTPEISPTQARRLLESVDCSRPVGVRDRAILGTLTYTGARVGAIASLRLRDLRDYGEYRSLRFTEKRGKEREIPLRLDLNQWLQAYLLVVDATGEGRDAPLFRPLSAGVSQPLFLSADRPVDHSLHAQAPPPRRQAPAHHHPAQLPGPWSSPTCWNRASPSRMSSTSSATPTRRRPRSTTAEPGRSPAKSSRGSPSDSPPNSPKEPPTMPTPKSVVLALVLWLFLGGLGIHRFYLNRPHALTILLLTLAGVVFSAFGIGLLLLFPVFVWLLIDLFRIPGWVREHNAQFSHG